MNVRNLCQPATFSGGRFCAHVEHGSKLLGNLQANCYATPLVGNPNNASGSLENGAMETSLERRKRKLIDLCNLHGVDLIAEKAVLSAESLKQIIKGYKSSYTPKRGGSSPSERALGDPAARAIEEAFDLERGWFDNDEEHMIRTPQELELVALFRQLDEPTRQVVVDAVRDARDNLTRTVENLRHRMSAHPPAASGVHGTSVLDSLTDVPSTVGTGKGRDKM